MYIVQSLSEIWGTLNKKDKKSAMSKKVHVNVNVLPEYNLNWLKKVEEEGMRRE